MAPMRANRPIRRRRAAENRGRRIAEERVRDAGLDAGDGVVGGDQRGHVLTEGLIRLPAVTVIFGWKAKR